MGLFKNKNLKKLMKIADKVIALEDEYKIKTNEELQAKTRELQSRAQNG